MRKTTLLMLTGVLGLVVGCSGDNPTEPVNGGTGEVPDNFTLEVTETVGVEGGSVETGSIALSVPAGAFDADQTLEVYSSLEEIPFDDAAKSRLYRIEGIPVDYSVPLGLRIAFEDTLKSDTLPGEDFIAIGQDVVVPSTGDTATTYLFIPARESENFFICEIPVPEEETGPPNKLFGSGRGGPSLSPYLKTLNANLQENYGLSGDFLVRNYSIPPQEWQLAELLVAIEDSRNWFNEQWPASGCLGSRELPVDVLVTDWGTTGGPQLEFCRFVPSWWGKDHGSIQYDRDAATEFGPEERAEIAHELGHLIQDLHDPRGRLTRAWNSDQAHLWLNEAVAVWAETEAALDPTFISYRRAGHEMAPFHGVQKGAEGDARGHGYGMSAIIGKVFESATPGGNWLWKVYSRIETGDHPIEALRAVTDQVQGWPEEYFRAYTQGSLSPDFGPSQAVDNAHGTFLISSENDTLKTFSNSYPDLSARIYKVILNYDGIDPGSSIEFTTEGRATDITVWKYKSGAGGVTDFAFLDNYLDQVVIEDAELLSSDNWNLLVMVTNERAVSPYTETTDIDLTVHLSKGLPFTHCYLKLDAFGVTEYVSGDIVDSDVLILRDHIHPYAEGSFSGNTFVGEWLEENEVLHTSVVGSLTAILSADRQTLVSIYATQSRYYQSNPTSIWTVFAENLPPDSNYPDELRFEVQGESTCDYVSILESESGLSASWSSILQSWYCDSGSEITVFFDMGK